MSKKNKKKSTVDWPTVIVTAIVDLTVGIILLVLDKLL